MSDNREYIYTELQLKKLCASIALVCICGNDDEYQEAIAEQILNIVDSIPSEEWERAYYLLAAKQND